MKKLTVMIAGAGGNNSWFTRYADEMLRKTQIPEHAEFVIYDGDDIEKKNLLYQDFELKDVTENKAKTLANRYAMQAHPKYIKDPKEFDPYDIVICGVDNPSFREMLFRYMDKHPEKYWIDTRAEGRVIAIYTKHKLNTLSILLDTLPKGDTGSTSCQLEYELSNGIIQLGNRIVSIICMQYLLNYIRGEENPASFVQMF